MKHWLLFVALPLLGGCVNLADIGEDPYAPRYQQSAYPAWWGRDAASVDIFFGSLGPYGAWQSYPGYGRVWVPHHVNAGWSPYWNGFWRNDPRYGRRWVSHDPFGFATDHYGQWQRHPTRGWFWVPGTRFQPGWTAPPPGWRPRPANWQPPATVQPRPRSPLAGQPYQRPPGEGRNIGRRQEGSEAWLGAARAIADPAAPRPNREGGKAVRPRGEGWQRPPDASGVAPSQPVRAERPASRTPRAERPVAAAPRADRGPPPRAPVPRVSPRDTSGGPIRED